MKSLNEKQYEYVPCYGKLIQGEQEYWLLSPVPLQLDSWMRDERAFLVTKYAPSDYIPGDNNVALFPPEFHVIVSGTYRIELKPPTNGYLWVEQREVWFEEPFEIDVEMTPEEIKKTEEYLDVFWKRVNAEPFFAEN